jgi:type II secretory pathway pseudopilin PulG
MRYGNDRVIGSRGTTLVELTVAVAIIAVVFAAVMPLFAGIRNSADARWANLEMVQNARVLNEQLCRWLAAARRITAVSADTSDSGYIQFETANGDSWRCALGEDGWVRFGPVGALSELAGPLDSLRFTCYDGNDLANPVAGPEAIRFVTWEVGLRSEGSMTRGRIVRGACGLRVAARPEQAIVTYDFAARRPGVDCFAFADQGKPQTPETLTTPAKAIESDQYAAIGADDGKYHVFQVPDDSQFAQVRLVFEVEQRAEDVASIVVTWKGRGVNTHVTAVDGAALYLWNYGASTYELIQSSPNTEAKVTLAGSGVGPAAQYMGGAAGKTVSLLVVSNDAKWGTENDALSTDYAKIDVTVSGGAGAFAP